MPLTPFFELGEGNPRHPDQLGELTPPRDGFRGIAAMLERVRVAVGAPLLAAPPCILHLRFPRTAGDWHKLPLRVRAPHRGARFMGDFSDCIGWFPGLLITPAPGGDGTDDRLGTGMDMDVLDGDALLTLAAVTVEGFGQSRVGSRELWSPVSGSHADRRKSGS